MFSQMRSPSAADSHSSFFLLRLISHLTVLLLSVTAVESVNLGITSSPFPGDVDCMEGVAEPSVYFAMEKPTLCICSPMWGNPWPTQFYDPPVPCLEFRMTGLDEYKFTFYLNYDDCGMLMPPPLVVDSLTVNMKTDLAQCRATDVEDLQYAVREYAWMGEWENFRVVRGDVIDEPDAFYARYYESEDCSGEPIIAVHGGVHQGLCWNLEVNEVNASCQTLNMADFGASEPTTFGWIRECGNSPWKADSKSLVYCLPTPFLSRLTMATTGLALVPFYSSFAVLAVLSIAVGLLVLLACQGRVRNQIRESFRKEAAEEIGNGVNPDELDSTVVEEHLSPALRRCCCTSIVAVVLMSFSAAIFVLGVVAVTVGVILMTSSVHFPFTLTVFLVSGGGPMMLLCGVIFVGTLGIALCCRCCYRRTLQQKQSDFVKSWESREPLQAEEGASIIFSDVTAPEDGVSRVLLARDRQGKYYSPTSSQDGTIIYEPQVVLDERDVIVVSHAFAPAEAPLERVANEPVLSEIESSANEARVSGMVRLIGQEDEDDDEGEEEEEAMEDDEEGEGEFLEEEEEEGDGDEEEGEIAECEESGEYIEDWFSEEEEEMEDEEGVDQ